LEKLKKRGNTPDGIKEKSSRRGKSFKGLIQTREERIFLTPQIGEKLKNPQKLPPQTLEREIMRGLKNWGKVKPHFEEIPRFPNSPNKSLT